MLATKTLTNMHHFQGLSDETLESIAVLCHEASFDKGTTILAEGRPANRIYLLSGSTPVRLLW